MTSKGTTGWQKGKLLSSCCGGRRGRSKRSLSRTRIPANPLHGSVAMDLDNPQRAACPKSLKRLHSPATSHVIGAKLVDCASASRTQHPSTRHFLVEQVQDPSDVPLRQRSCGCESFEKLANRGDVM